MTTTKTRAFTRIAYPPLHSGLLVVICITLQLLTACATNRPDSINLMPAPDIYALGDIDPFSSLDELKQFPYRGILYATDRAPAEDGSQFFKNERGNLIRVGIGRLQVAKKDLSVTKTKQPFVPVNSLSYIHQERMYCS